MEGRRSSFVLDSAKIFMSYTSRILGPEEYYKLESLGIPRDRLPNPATSVVGVIEVDGVIVARWMALNVVMLEGLQIDAEYQKRPGVARRLLNLMLGTLRARGIVAATTIVQDSGVGELARHAGFNRVPGTLYQKDLREK